MSNNSNLGDAKKAKNDEFYTQYFDVEKQMQSYLDYNPKLFQDKVVLLPCDDPEWSNFTKYFAQRFSELGLKKLISTCYHTDDSDDKGKVLVLNRDTFNSTTINATFDWEYLQGDGDFRSEEVTRFRNEADMIITNPPFSLFREFLAWIVIANKKFSIIGNMNAVTYKDVFPLFKSNELWFGCTISSGDREFRVPERYPLEAAFFRVDDNGNKFIRVKGVRWFTNIENGKRHQPLNLDTMDNNLLVNSEIKKNPNSYQKYQNYHAIEVPRTNGIPSDYDGVMGVPISFLDKYCPNQFEILGMDFEVKDGLLPALMNQDWQGKLDRPYIDNKRMYSRIFIQHKG